MSISLATRQRLRQTLRSLEMADEIIDLLNQASEDSVNFIQNFSVLDWVSSESGDTYSLTITHNLNTLKPEVAVYENDLEVNLHKVQVVDSNTVKLFVSQASSDSRFAGKVIIDV